MESKPTFGFAAMIVMVSLVSSGDATAAPRDVIQLPTTVHNPPPDGISELAYDGDPESAYWRSAGNHELSTIVSEHTLRRPTRIDSIYWKAYVFGFTAGEDGRFCTLRLSLDYKTTNNPEWMEVPGSSRPGLGPQNCDGTLDIPPGRPLEETLTGLGLRKVTDIRVEAFGDAYSDPPPEDASAGSSTYIYEIQAFVASIRGDANVDGVIDIDDLNSVRNHFGESGPADGTLEGDVYPFDGVVNIDDLNAVRNNFGAGTTSVPEPQTLTVTFLALLGILACRSSSPRVLK